MEYQLFSYMSLPSTNETAKEKARAGAGEGTVIIAAEQTRGRGRHRHHWFSPPGLGLWFSLILRPKIELAQAPQLTFVGAVAVCRAVRKMTGLAVGLKWPNDLLYRGQKLGGILTEAGSTGHCLDYVIVGIGLNVAHREEDFPPEIRETATSLSLAGGRDWPPRELLQMILAEYRVEYELYGREGLAPILRSWREFNVTLGQEVKVSTREGSFVGLAEDIDDNGCLLVRRGSGRVEPLWAGEVRLGGASFEPD